jgi:glycosyltransferase involved in cell wall biosynthesis
VVAFDLKETRYSADGAALLVQPGAVDEFSFALKQLIDEPDTRKRMGKVGLRRIEEELNWEKASQSLKKHMNH